MERLISALAVAATLVSGIAPAAAQFISGADMSLLPFFEARGVSYCDQGQPADALEILRNHGLNCVRLRLFTSDALQAASDPYNRINNLDYTVSLARRVKSAGLQLLLDFHYSDTWADPGHQAKPAAWQSLSFTDLVQQVRSYSSNCIAAFKAAGAPPDYVQVGNEITSGLLWPDGRVGGNADTAAQWSKLAQLLNSAIEGIRAAAGNTMPKVIIHIDRGGDWTGTQWFFDNLLRNQVEFDIIGESYYPFWHGPLSNLSRCLTNAVERYQKPVLVAETAFPWQGSTNVYGLPASPAGQVQFVASLAQVVGSIPKQKGIGIIWWGTEYQRLAGFNLAGFEQRSFFNDEGGVLPVADAFGGLVAPLVIKANAAGNSLQLAWPLSGAGLMLMLSTNLASNSWKPIAISAQITGISLGTRVPNGGNRISFYRLQSN